MDIEIHKTIMMDGETVTDVDIMTNTRNGVIPRCIVTFNGVIPRCTVTFNDEDRALDFAIRLHNLLDEFGMTANIEVL